MIGCLMKITVMINLFMDCIQYISRHSKSLDRTSEDSNLHDRLLPHTQYNTCHHTGIPQNTA
jgi:hypothetical protein